MLQLKHTLTHVIKIIRLESYLWKVVVTTLIVCAHFECINFIDLHLSTIKHSFNLNDICTLPKVRVLYLVFLHFFHILICQNHHFRFFFDIWNVIQIKTIFQVSDIEIGNRKKISKQSMYTYAYVFSSVYICYCCSYFKNSRYTW